MTLFVTTSLKKIDLELHPDWRPIETYDQVKPQQVLVANKEKRWIRFGRKFHGLNRWYYSGTTEYSQYPERGDADIPTHWMPIPYGPWELDNV